MIYDNGEYLMVNQPSCYVFLGGACNPTTWRTKIAIPTLEASGVSYYNPQVEDWYPELVAIESAAKEAASELLFVLSGQTRGVATLIEATEAICTGRTVRIVIENIPDGMDIGGKLITGRELKDLNNARQYLADIAARYGVMIHASIGDAVTEIVKAAVVVTAPRGLPDERRSSL